MQIYPSNGIKSPNFICRHADWRIPAEAVSTPSPSPPVGNESTPRQPSTGRRERSRRAAWNMEEEYANLMAKVQEVNSARRATRRLSTSPSPSPAPIVPKLNLGALSIAGGLQNQPPNRLSARVQLDTESTSAAIAVSARRPATSRFAVEAASQRRVQTARQADAKTVRFEPATARISRRDTHIQLKDLLASKQDKTPVDSKPTKSSTGPLQSRQTVLPSAPVPVEKLRRKTPPPSASFTIRRSPPPTRQKSKEKMFQDQEKSEQEHQRTLHGGVPQRCSEEACMETQPIQQSSVESSSMLCQSTWVAPLPLPLSQRETRLMSMPLSARGSKYSVHAPSYTTPLRLDPTGRILLECIANGTKISDMLCECSRGIVMKKYWVRPGVMGGKGGSVRRIRFTRLQQGQLELHYRRYGFWKTITALVRRMIIPSWQWNTSLYIVLDTDRGMLRLAPNSMHEFSRWVVGLNAVLLGQENIAAEIADVCWSKSVLLQL